MFLTSILFNNKYKKIIYKNNIFADQNRLNKLNKIDKFDYKKVIEESNSKYIKKILESNDNKNKKYEKNLIEIDSLKNNKSNLYFNSFFVIFVLSGLWIYNKR